MMPLSKSAVEVKSYPKGLRIVDWTIRQGRKLDEEDSGWMLQALLKNETLSALKDIKTEVRYFDSGGKFIGVDEGFSISDDMERKEDKSATISLSVPSGVSKAIFSVKGKRTNFFEKHSILVFGVMFLVASLFYTFGGLLTRK